VSGSAWRYPTDRVLDVRRVGAEVLGHTHRLGPSLAHLVGIGEQIELQHLRYEVGRHEALQVLPLLELLAWVAKEHEHRLEHAEREPVDFFVPGKLCKRLVGVEAAELGAHLHLQLGREQQAQVVVLFLRVTNRRKRRRVAHMRTLDVVHALLEHRGEGM